MQQFPRTHGVSLVEILIGVSLFALVLVFSVHTLQTFFTAATYAREQSVARTLAQSGVESVRWIRDEDWNSIAALTVGSDYYLEYTGSDIALGTTPEIIGGTYTRTVVVEAAYRDGDDDLVTSTTSGAVSDSDSRWATVTVSWGSRSVSMQTLLTNVFDI